MSIEVAVGIGASVGKIFIGVLVWAFGTGKIKVSKNEEVQMNWLKRRGMFFQYGGIVMAGWGILSVFFDIYRHL